MRFPRVTGTVTITDEKGKTVIGGDPAGLKSLAGLLIWLADQDLKQWPYLPPDGLAHVHLYPNLDLAEGSRETEVVRLDPKPRAEA